MLIRMFPCEFCKNSYSSKSSLNAHKKTAKFCLEIQGKTNTEFSCQYCQVFFSQKHILDTHEPKCSEKITFEHNREISLLSDEILKLKQKILTINLSKNKQKKTYDDHILVLEAKHQLCIKDLEDKHEIRVKDLEAKHEKAMTNLYETNRGLQATISDLAKQGMSKPTNINTIKQNFYNNMTAINLEENHVTSGISKITLQDVCDYSDGIADVLKKHLLLDELECLTYICTDVPRKKFRFKDKDGKIQTDINCKMLFEKSHEILINHLVDIIGSEMDRIGESDIMYNEYYNILAKYRQPKFRKDLAASIARITSSENHGLIAVLDN